MFKRAGFYFNPTSIAIPVGGRFLYNKQKIHSSHPDFETINNRFFLEYLQHEADVSRSEWGLYRDFDTSNTSVEFVPEPKKEVEVIVLPETLKDPEVKVFENVPAHIETAKGELNINVTEDPVNAMDTVLGESVEEPIEEIVVEEPKVEEKPKKRTKKTKTEDPK